MSNVVEFYKDILKTFNVTEENNKLVFHTSTGKKIPLTLEGSPLILPRKELIADIVEIVDGKPRLKARIFNPLAESVIRGENKSLTKIRKHIERMMEYSFIVVSTLLLHGVRYQEDLEDCDPMFLKFLDMLKYKQPGVKKVVDDETIKKWEEISDIATQKEKQLLHIFIKKGGKIGDVKYTRIGTLMFPLYEELEEMNVKEDLVFNKVRLRNKDKFVIQKLYEFIFELSHDELIDGFTVGTRNTTSPSFIVTMMLYDFAKNKINKAIEVAKSLNLDNELLDTVILPELPISIEELEKFIDKIKYELLEIPSDSDLLIMDFSSSNNQPTPTTNTSNKTIPTNNPVNNEPKSVFDTIHQQQQQQVVSNVNNNDSDELSPEEAMRLFGMKGFPSNMTPQYGNPQPGYVPPSYTPPVSNQYQPPATSSTGNVLLDGMRAAEMKAMEERMREAYNRQPMPSYTPPGYNGLNNNPNLPPRMNNYPQPNYNPYAGQPTYNPYPNPQSYNQQPQMSVMNPYDPYRRY